jgi:transposase
VVGVVKLQRLSESKHVLLTPVSCQRGSDLLLRGPAGRLPPARHRDKTANASTFDARAALHVVLGVDLTQIHGLGPSLALKLIGECRTDLSALAKRQTLHFLAMPGAGQQDLGGQGVFDANAAIRQQSAALLKLTAVTVGRTQTALSAFYRRLSVHVGKAKAVTAAARKIATLFYNTLRHGIDYADPGVSYYEDRYRARLSPTFDDAKSLGYMLHEMPAPA